jgi:spermidine/putrescine ABC transporter ATP-binding subunit
MTPAPIIRLERLAKRYGPVEAVRGVDLEIAEGEFLTLLGPSGCGKTTIIRMIAGYVEATAGRIFLDGRDITDDPPQKRRIGMVFQHYALFPHLTVEDNVGFALKIEGKPRDFIRRRVAEMLELVHLPSVARRYPGELSGGQQQRVALARALAFSPRILLMDEPLGALDLKLREQMQQELKRIQQEVGITTIHVTHDQEEALSMSDRVVVMEPGRIVQIDTPEALYDRPLTKYVADFVGKINLIEAEVVGADPDTVRCQFFGVEPPVVVRCPAPRGWNPGGRVILGIRPEHLRLSPPSSGGGWIGRVEKIRFVGSYQFAAVRAGGELSLLVADSRKEAQVGKTCVIEIDESRVLLFETGAEERERHAARG